MDDVVACALACRHVLLYVHAMWHKSDSHMTRVIKG